MKEHHLQVKAARAVKRLAVDLEDIPPEPPPSSGKTSPFGLSKSGAAKLKLREVHLHSSGKVSHELSPMPGINALAFTIRYLPGGRDQFLELVKLAALNGDAHATAWWMVYADLPPSLRVRANFDDVCQAAGVKPSELMAGVVGHAMEAGTDAANLVAAVCHPEVLAAAAKSAVRIGGQHAAIAAEDRKQLLQARGFLPVPKGASIHVHANANATAAAASAAEPSVPTFAHDMAALREGDVIVEAVPPDEA